MAGGDKFKQGIAPWDDAKLAEFLAYRKWLLTEGPGNICTPTKAKGIEKHAPFMASNYPHQHLLGNIVSKEWRQVFRVPSSELVNPDPFADSPYRAGGKQVWDAAVGIPACTHRTAEIVSMAKTPALRQCNRHWNSVIVPALKAVGPLGPNQELLRPTAPYLLDFTKLQDGWMYIEAAHVLAHMRGDTKQASKNASAIPSSTAGHFQAALANIAVALLYDIPLYVGRYDEGVYAMPDFSDYGIEVKSSSRFGMPFLRAPWINREALRVDATLAVVSVGVFTEPHPYGYNSGTLEPAPNDHWCCMPTSAMVTGWETVDVITHQPLVSADPEDALKPVCYGMHPADLMPPDTLWAYLALGQRHINRPPLVDATHVYVKDWINSPGFAALLQQTRPLPCKMCLSWNYRTEGMPRRPNGYPPKPSQLKQHKDWVAYYAEVDKVLKILDPAVQKYELKLYGGSRLRNRIRKARMRNWKAKMAIVADERKLDEAFEKLRKGKTLNGRHALVYSAYRSRIEHESNTKSKEAIDDTISDRSW